MHVHVLSDILHVLHGLQEIKTFKKTELLLIEVNTCTLQL